MYRDRTLPRFTVHLLYTYCTLTVHLLYTTGFVYTCTVNWFCVCLYSKLVFCTLHWQLKDVRWNSVLGTHRQSNRHSNICTSRAASSQLKTLTCLICLILRTASLTVTECERYPEGAGKTIVWHNCLHVSSFSTAKPSIPSFSSSCPQFAINAGCLMATDLCKWHWLSWPTYYWHKCPHTFQDTHSSLLYLQRREMWVRVPKLNNCCEFT